MTTELEQEFFKTFEIKKLKYYWCKRFDRTSIADCNGIKKPEIHCAKCENGYIKEYYYPEITDSKLLEMICIMNKHIHKHNEFALCPVAGENLEEVKNYMLRLFNFNQPLLEKIFIQEIQQLFKGEE